jgi:quinol monooxygenase YgiN
MSGSLLIVHVHVRVVPGSEQAFRSATLANAEASRREPGILRFDVLQDRDDPPRFVLVEIYRDEAAAAAHKQTEHYARWRDAVAGLMAEPRRGLRHVNLSPDDTGF